MYVDTRGPGLVQGQGVADLGHAPPEGDHVANPDKRSNLILRIQLHLRDYFFSTKLYMITLKDLSNYESNFNDWKTSYRNFTHKLLKRSENVKQYKIVNKIINILTRKMNKISLFLRKNVVDCEAFIFDNINHSFSLINYLKSVEGVQEIYWPIDLRGGVSKTIAFDN